MGTNSRDWALEAYAAAHNIDPDGVEPDDENLEEVRDIVFNAIVQAVADVSAPKAGVLHPADQAFYDLTVQQRNAAWAEVEVLKSRLAAHEGHLDKFKAAVGTTLDDYYAYGGREGCSCHGYEYYIDIDPDEFWATVERHLNG